MHRHADRGQTPDSSVRASLHNTILPATKELSDGPGILHLLVSRQVRYRPSRPAWRTAPKRIRETSRRGGRPASRRAPRAGGVPPAVARPSRRATRTHRGRPSDAESMKHSWLRREGRSPLAAGPPPTSASRRRPIADLPGESRQAGHRGRRVSCRRTSTRHPDPIIETTIKEVGAKGF